MSVIHKLCSFSGYETRVAVAVGVYLILMVELWVERSGLPWAPEHCVGYGVGCVSSFSVRVSCVVSCWLATLAFFCSPASCMLTGRKCVSLLASFRCFEMYNGGLARYVIMYLDVGYDTSVKKVIRVWAFVNNHICQKHVSRGHVCTPTHQNCVSFLQRRSKAVCRNTHYRGWGQHRPVSGARKGG